MVSALWSLRGCCGSGRVKWYDSAPPPAPFGLSSVQGSTERAQPLKQSSTAIALLRALHVTDGETEARGGCSQGGSPGNQWRAGMELGWSAGQWHSPCSSPTLPLGVAACRAWRPQPATHGPPSRAPDPFLSPVSDVPKGAETFGVSGSSGVEVFMVYDPARVAEPTGKARWPLDARVDVIVSVDAASKALNDLKVRGHFPTEEPLQSTPAFTHHPHSTKP